MTTATKVKDAECTCCGDMFQSAGIMPVCEPCTLAHAIAIGLIPRERPAMLFTIRTALRTFACAFNRDELYETGYGDVWLVSGAMIADDGPSMLQALAYVQGAADAAKIVCPYMGRGWRVATQMSAAAAALSVALEGRRPLAEVQRLITRYTLEFRNLIADEKLSA